MFISFQVVFCPRFPLSLFLYLFLCLYLSFECDCVLFTTIDRVPTRSQPIQIRASTRLFIKIKWSNNVADSKKRAYAQHDANGTNDSSRKDNVELGGYTVYVLRSTFVGNCTARAMPKRELYLFTIFCSCAFQSLLLSWTFSVCFRYFDCIVFCFCYFKLFEIDITELHLLCTRLWHARSSVLRRGVDKQRIWTKFEPHKELLLLEFGKNVRHLMRNKLINNFDCLQAMSITGAAATIASLANCTVKWRKKINIQFLNASQ